MNCSPSPLYDCRQNTYGTCGYAEVRAPLSQLKAINRQFGQTVYRSPALTNEHTDMTKPSLPSHRVEK